MATHAHTPGALIRAPFMPAPPAAITRLLSRFDRDQLAGFIAVAIDLLDVADGDTEIELNGDELDGTDAEDEIGGGDGNMMYQGGAGCPISDPGEEDDHAGGDEGI